MIMRISFRKFSMLPLKVVGETMLKDLIERINLGWTMKDD